jgi:hypothetical protein
MLGTRSIHSTTVLGLTKGTAVDIKIGFFEAIEGIIARSVVSDFTPLENLNSFFQKD